MHPPAISQKKNFPKNVLNRKEKQKKSWIQKNQSVAVKSANLCQ